MTRGVTTVTQRDQVRRIVCTALLARNQVMDVEVARGELAITLSTRELVASKHGLPN